MQPDDLTPVTELTDDQIADLTKLYGTYHSWADRKGDAVRQAVEHSDEVLALIIPNTEELFACARVITDYTYYATVYDVIVSPDVRRRGVGTRLMETVVTHDPLTELDLYLGARDGLVGFYEACGFERRDMTITLPGITENLNPMVYRRES